MITAVEPGSSRGWRTRKRVLQGVAVIAIIILIAAYSFGSRPTALLNIARPIADCSEWFGPSFWISNREIAAPDARDGSGMTSRAFDATTGVQRRLPELAAALARAHATSNRFASPDGQWILIDHLGSAPYYDAVSTDGKRYLRWPRLHSEESSGGSVPWFADSKRWVYVFRSEVFEKAVIRSIDDVTKRTEIPWPRFASSGGSTMEDVDVGLKDNLAIVIRVTSAQRCQSQVSWHKRDLLTGKVGTLVVPTSGSEEVRSVDAAPGGRELAWWVWHKHTERSQWTARLMQFFGDTNQDYESLRITDENGGHIREIGRLPVDVIGVSSHGCTFENPNGPTGANWSPDANRLSFQTKDKLWVIAVH